MPSKRNKKASSSSDSDASTKIPSSEELMDVLSNDTEISVNDACTACHPPATVPVEAMQVRSFKTPKEVYAMLAVNGENRGGMPLLRLCVQAFLAGVLIAIGATTAISLGPQGGKALVAASFPVGLILIVLTGADLFTGDMLFFTSAFMTRKLGIAKMAMAWLVDYLFNFLGSLFVVFVFVWWADLLDRPAKDFVAALAEKKIVAGWGSQVLKGAGCNYLVSLALFCATSAQDVSGKILAIWFPISAFVAMGMEHSVANMFFIPMGMLHGANVSVGEFLWLNLVPVTIGNILGGALFASMSWYFLFGFVPHDHHPDDKRTWKCL